MVKLTERQKRPDHIRPWDIFVYPSTRKEFENSYVGWHKSLALEELNELRDKYDLKIHTSYMGDDGWLDGFKCIHAIVETKSEALLKLKWHDGNQSFMKRSSGWSILSESDLQ
jgi:hypothetical protein